MTAVPTSVAHFRDTTQPQLIGTSGIDGVLAYANGKYRWPTPEISRFVEAGKRVHLIDVDGNGWQIADILDVERFDATVDQVPEWVEKRWAFHSTAAVYCSRSTVPAVISVLDGRPCYLIVADWTNAPHLPAMELAPRVVIAAVQYASYTNYDEVAVYSRGWLEGVRL